MDDSQARTYARLLEEAGRFHGDICRGIEIGTRMTMTGLREIGIADPKGEDRKNLVVFAEIDRCATDAITALTGCRPGKRTMKVLDYGKMAATFVNLQTGRAVRVAMREKNEDSPDEVVPLDTVPDAALFRVTEVEVDLRPEDLPGRPLRACTCARCGENVMDGRDIVADGETLCRPCFERKAYYRPRGGAGV
jgi:formylmethanofuran dehydrogenase subunit E